LIDSGKNFVSSNLSLVILRLDDLRQKFSERSYRM